MVDGAEIGTLQGGGGCAGLGRGDSCGKTNVAASWKEQMSLVLGWTKKPEDRGRLHRADLSRLLPFQSTIQKLTGLLCLSQPSAAAELQGIYLSLGGHAWVLSGLWGESRYLVIKSPACFPPHRGQEGP